MDNEKITKTFVVTEAMHRIKDIISSEHYQVGDKIPTEVEFAERFGIGRSSIREAIKVFQYLGILEARVPKGTFICEASNIAAEFLTWFTLLNQKEIFEILEMREIMELQGIYNMIKNSQEDSLDLSERIIQLELQIDKMKKAISARDYDNIMLADFNFHKLLIEETDNKLFLAIYDVLHAFTKEGMHKTHENYSDLNNLVEDHVNIINALKTKNPLTAIETHSNHFSLIKQYLNHKNDQQVTG